MSFQSVSNSVYSSKYQLFDKHGNEIDESRSHSFMRVAHALAKNEKDVQYWADAFFAAMCNGAIPAGRIMGNAGAEEHKPNTSLINCLAGETPVLTDKGIFTIRALAEMGTVNVLNGAGNWSAVNFSSYGVQPVYKLGFKFADSKQIRTIRATSNHRWIMPSGRIITTEFWLSGDRAKGFNVVPNVRIPEFSLNEEDYFFGLLHGLVYGDGNRNHQHEDEFDLTLCNHKMELAPIVEELTGQKVFGPYIMNATTNCQALRFTRISSAFDLKGLPSVESSPSYIKGFITGLLNTDGTVWGTEDRSMTIRIYGQKDLMDYLNTYLPITGMLPSTGSTQMAKVGDETNYGKRNKSIYQYNLHPNSIDANDLLLEKYRKVFKTTENGATQVQKWFFVKADDKSELAEVFCCQESETGSFCLMHGLLTGNCIVSDTIYDRIEGIGQSVKDSLITLSGGSGIGYDFSSLRPKGSYVNGVKAQTSGPLPFADIFDKGCFTIASAGGRRGAQMATFDLRHPDVLSFIKAKRENGRFRQFNISVLIPHSFFNEEKDWIFRFPIRNSDPALDTAETIWDTWHVKDTAYITNEHGQTLFKIYGKIPKSELWDLILQSNYDYAEPGVIFIDRLNEENNLWFCEEIRASNPCVVAGTQVLTKDGYKSIETLVGQAVDIWNGYEWSNVVPKITGENQKVLNVQFSNGSSLTCTLYHRFKLQDNITIEAQDLKLYDKIETFFMPEGDKCKNIEVIKLEDVGIADLVYCFNEPKRHTAIFNGILSRNCGEQPLPPNGSCLLGSIDLTQFVEQPFTDSANFNFEMFAETVEVFTRMLDNVVEFNNLPLQAQRDEIIRKRRHGMGFFGLGSALILLGIRYDSSQALEFAEKVTKLMAIRGYVTGCALAEEKGSAPVLDEYFEITPEIVKKNANFKDRLGQKVKGIELFLASPYMQRLLADEPVLKDRLLQHGCRFSHHTSIAPTGTISLAFGNNTSGGVEPSFSHQYFRNLTVQDKKTRQQEAVYSKEFLLYKELYGQNKTDEELLKSLPDYFVTADTISWKAHVDMVAVVQKWVDSSISKTVNTPTNITLEEFKGIYDYAYEVGCKAVSTFRYNPETLGSILSRSEDLANSRYEFKLADGTVIQCAGGDRVEYDGEVTTAENLFSALKENTYGKF